MRGLLACALLVLPLGAADEKTVKSSGPDKSIPKILWHEPRPTTLQDWICGPGGCDKAPKEPFQLIREDAGGTNPKVTVRDGAGHMWSAKFGAEVIPECFASRFVTALGYLAEPTYFVASGRIEGVEKLRRVREFVKKDGTFRKARFEMRGQKDFVVQQGQSWSWPDNPFLGSHELAGLKILMMLLSNWDAKDARDREESNNAVFRVEDGQRTILFYGVFDWGASLGHWGGLLRRDQSDCASYTQDTPHLVQGLRQNQVKWGFSGKHDTDLKNGISVEHVRWLLRYLQPITPEQLQTGLKASGATERQSGCWARAIDDRIQELRAIAR